MSNILIKILFSSATLSLISFAISQILRLTLKKWIHEKEARLLFAKELAIAADAITDQLVARYQESWVQFIDEAIDDAIEALGLNKSKIGKNRMIAIEREIKTQARRKSKNML